MKLAIVPGSFDPMTLGHLDVIACAAKRYEKVVVAVMINASKKYLFDMETRVRIAERTVASFPNVRVISDRGLLVDLYKKLNADAVCKGWRNPDDLRYELQMAEWNRSRLPGFRTELIHAKNTRDELSSTVVREMLLRHEIPEGLVHPDALPLILSHCEQMN